MYKEYVRDKRFLISSDGKSVVKKVNQDLYKEEGGKFLYVGVHIIKNGCLLLKTQSLQ